MAVDVVGIGVRVCAVGAGGWFCRRVAIRSICFFHGPELLLLLPLVVSVLLLVAINLFICGLHKGL